MTIVAGFRCKEGIVLCADTLETIPGIYKRDVPKLVFKPTASVPVGDELAAAFCGATDNGPFLDVLIEETWEVLRHASSLDEGCERIKEKIKDYYREAGSICQRGFCPTAELIYGIKMNGSSRLFHADGPWVCEKELYATGGCGQYLADFLIQHMGAGYLMNLRQCLILSAYVLFQAKEHVDGCGGDTHIAVLRNKGTSGIAESRLIEEHIRLVALSDTGIGTLAIRSADFEEPWKAVEGDWQSIIRRIAKEREEKGKKLKDWHEFFKEDDLGLPT